MLSYNQSALEQQLVKGIEPTIGWPWKLSMFSVVVFATVGALYLGLNYGFKDVYLTSRNTQLDSDLKKLELKEDQKQNLINIYSQMSNISDVLKTRKFGTTVFDALEKSALKQIRFDTLSLTYSKNQTTWKLTGDAQTYELLSQQLSVLKSLEGVKSVNLNSATFDNQSKTIKFTVSLIF